MTRSIEDKYDADSEREGENNDHDQNIKQGNRWSEDMN